LVKKLPIPIVFQAMLYKKTVEWVFVPITVKAPNSLVLNPRFEKLEEKKERKE
jgi:hypothetical protein